MVCFQSLRTVHVLGALVIGLGAAGSVHAQTLTVAAIDPSGAPAEHVASPRVGTLGTLGLPGEAIEMQTVGLKLRLFGDAVYTRTPQISFGLQHKQTLDFEIPSAVGAMREDAVDIYLAGTKVFLGALGARNLLVNTTLRATRANQIGLLGFEDSYEIHPEVSLGLLLDEKTIIGVEYRAKPDNLAFSEEEAWRDFFIGYFPSKHLALVAAYGELGTVATLPDQSGLYLSLQATF